MQGTPVRPPRTLLFVSPSTCPPALRDALAAQGCALACARTMRAAIALQRTVHAGAGLVLLDRNTRDFTADFQQFRAADDRCEWVLVLPPHALEDPILAELVLHHCFDHHTHPADPHFLARAVGHAFGRAELRDRTAAAQEGAEQGLVGSSSPARQLRRIVRRLAPTVSPVLIQGESGSGKEAVARALHQASSFAQAPLAVVDCSAYPADGSGMFERAAGTTLVLDHVQDLPRDGQARLLRFLTEQAWRRTRAGAEASLARVVALCERPLYDAVAGERFRQDLYYRLCVLTVEVPPLRDRKADIVPIARHFLAGIARDTGMPARTLGQSAIAVMEAHAWPGNVRELQNRLHRAVLLGEQRLLGPTDLGLQAARQEGATDSLDTIRVRAEKDAIATSLDRVGNNVSLAARELGVSRMTLYRLMAKYAIEPRTETT